MKLDIKCVESSSLLPIELLLLADPSVEMINKYLDKSENYLASINDEKIGVIIVQNNNNNRKEIKNIAIKEEFQNKGFGKRILEYIINKERFNGTKVLEIGTGNSSINQLALYQKVGFRISSIDFDYFSKNYPNKIIENGIECKDMIRLKLEL